MIAGKTWREIRVMALVYLLILELLAVPVILLWPDLYNDLGLLPYVFGVYVVVGFGLMPLRGGLGLGRVLATLFFVGMGAWCLRSQWRLTDLHLFVGSLSEPAAEPDGGDIATG